MSNLQASAQNRHAHIVLLANIKGGSGKSTTAMHLAVALQHAGFTVGYMDLDTDQRTLDTYMSNRTETATFKAFELPPMLKRKVHASDHDDRRSREAEEEAGFSAALVDILPRVDVLIIDTPGARTYLSLLAHAVADTVISPMNDSDIDIDLFAKFDARARMYTEPSIYALYVWEANKIREHQGLPPLDWTVVVNKYDRNFDVKRGAPWSRLELLGSQAVIQDGNGKTRRGLGFRVVQGMADRRIYRDLFQHGLTLFDLDAPDQSNPRFREYMEALGEANEFLRSLNIPILNKSLSGAAPAKSLPEAANG